MITAEGKARALETKVGQEIVAKTNTEEPYHIVEGHTYKVLAVKSFPPKSKNPTNVFIKVRDEDGKEKEIGYYEFYGFELAAQPVR